MIQGDNMNKIILVTVVLLLLGLLLYAEETVIPQNENPVPRFEKRDAFLVIGLETKDDMEGDNMMNVWMDFFKVQSKIPETIGKDMYGITYMGESYDPDTMKGYIYFVGMRVKEECNVPEGLLLHKVPAGYYAVFEHKGKVENIGNTYNYIYGEWTYTSGYKPLMQDVFELYGDRFIDGSEESVTEIWIPVVMPEVKE